jgi:hypothetical protein
MLHFHCAASLLAPESIIEPGNWGRIIRNAGWSHNLAAREVILEHIRGVSYPQKPSRLDALFFFDDETEARFYAASDGRHVTMMVYEIELLDASAVRHTADWRNVSGRGPLNLDWASEYWQGVYLPPHPDPAWPVACREVLAVSQARILRRL